MTGSPAVVVWMDADGRAEALAARLGATLVTNSRRGPLPVRYARGALRTWRAARAAGEVVVTNPPVVALLAAAAGSRRVVADHHGGAFNDPRWRWSLRVVRLLERRVLAHLTPSPDHAAEAGRRFRRPVLVLDCPPPRAAGADADVADAAAEGRADVVVVASHAFDEPIDAVLAAAWMLPEISFLLTGRPTSELALPPNVSAPGWLPEPDYRRAVAGARVVACLTTRPGTMQQGAYDALAAGRPLVTSDHDVLRQFFADAAVYVGSSAAAIADGVSAALADHEHLAQAARRRRAWWERRVDEQLAELRRVLSCA